MTSLILFLVLLSGFSWILVYLSMIYTGLKEKTYCMPFFALAFNIAWETVFTITDFTNKTINLQSYVNFAWFFFDLFIIYTYFKYGKKDFGEKADKNLFVPWSILIFIMAFILEYGFYVQFGPAPFPNIPIAKYVVVHSLGAQYAAFLQNLLMSILFITMLVSGKNFRGQNMFIAVFKWIGTLAPTILLGYIFENNLILIIGIFCSVFDLIYIWLLRRYKKLYKLSNDLHLQKFNIVSK